MTIPDVSRKRRLMSIMMMSLPGLSIADLQFDYSVIIAIIIGINVALRESQD